jgi:glycosyltransferase involved in cell wall biosynthesis
VSTSLGWEGLPYVQPGRHFLVADAAPDFAAATVRLLTEPELRARLAAEARDLAEHRYDWRGLGDEQEDVLSDVLARARPSRREEDAAT